VKRPCLLLLPLLAFLLLGCTIAWSAPSKSPPKKSAPPKSAAKTQATGKRSHSVRRTPARAQAVRQQQPEPQRIREIQQALTQHGYPVEPTGVWDAATVEALRKFQEDHGIKNLSGRGKLDPLTLIALGLGPSNTRLAPSGVPEAPNSTEGKQP
jgi:peptidoglycan hydrolase-like protein with peptidoglycan-binding domain